MSIASEELQSIAAEWRRARRIYPIYIGVIERFGLSIPPSPELNCPIDRAEPSTVAKLRSWLQQAEEQIGAHHLRFFLQTSPLATEEGLAGVVQHLILKKSGFTAADRDKLDFVLVQYFTHCAPFAMLKGEPSFADVSRVLEPLLGPVSPGAVGWLEPLERMRIRIKTCLTMHDLLHHRILVEFRALKISAGEDFRNPPIMVAFTRLNYLFRQAFFRLMLADVDAITDGVRELRRRGISVIDCSRAQLSSAEPLAHLLEISPYWKKPFQAEYSAGNPFTQLVELRAAVDDAMAQSQSATNRALAPLPSLMQSDLHSPPRHSRDITSTAQLDAAGAQQPPGEIWKQI